MWLHTIHGFFSIVQKPEDFTDRTLTIRARARGDLETLRQRYLPRMGEITTGGGTDYPYRARISRDELGRCLAEMVNDIEYGNFKDAVQAGQGAPRAAIYERVWSALVDIERMDAR